MWIKPLLSGSVSGSFFFTIYSFSLKRIGFFLGSALTLLSVIILSVCILIYRKK